jgi:hypothetical protein
MRSISHWGLYEDFDSEVVVGPSNAANAFHGAMQLSQMVAQAESLNKMYHNMARRGPILQKLNFGPELG